jgi:hypothetical protein
MRAGRKIVERLERKAVERRGALSAEDAGRDLLVSREQRRHQVFPREILFAFARGTICTEHLGFRGRV